MLALAERDFESAPAWVHDQLQACFRGWLSTKVTEDSFHALQRRAQGSGNGPLSRTQRWQTICQTPLLTEYGGAPVQASCAARGEAHARPTPKTVFEASGGKCSVADPDLARFREMGTTPRPDTFNEVRYAWMSALRLQQLADLKIAWQSLLMKPGCAISHKEEGGGIALHSCSHSVVLRRARQLVIGGTRLFT